MYCVKCGVKLADTEGKCPLCNTRVCHPDFQIEDSQPLYPVNKMPKNSPKAQAVNGALIILFLIPLLICFFADISVDGNLEWFGYVAGALMLAYTVVALPMWFTKPNPVIFVPCDFAAIGLYLLYIDLVSGGSWYLGFALPVTAGLCLIVCTVVTLLRYLRKGRLYIFGGAFMALGAYVVLIELLLGITFQVRFTGWSVYPLCALFLLGGLLIYFAIHRGARQIMERKLFF